MGLKTQENFRNWNRALGPRRSIRANNCIHFSLTVLHLLSGQTVAVPGPCLPLMPAGVTPDTFNVKLLLLMTPSQVFSSYLAKQPVMCEIFPSLFFSPSVALTARLPITKFSSPHKRLRRGVNAFLLVLQLEKWESESKSLMLKYLCDFA